MLLSSEQISRASYFKVAQRNLKACSEGSKLPYGVKSLDGREFYKDEEILKKFKATEAYSIFYTKLINDSAAAADFIKGIIPNDISAGLPENIDPKDFDM